MAIHKFDDGCCTISSHHTGLPGCFENERTAKYAFQFSNFDLQELQKRANERSGGAGGAITFADLQELKKKPQTKFE